MAAGLAIQGITKNVVFSTRRTDKAVNHSDNFVVSFGNADVASGQIKNALDSAGLLAKESKLGIVSGFKGAHAALKNISDGSKVLQGAGKVIEFTADHLNPVITVVGAAKVITAEDKAEAFNEEAPAIGCMFAFEEVTKNVLEMEKKVKDPVTGKKISKKRISILRSNPFLNEQYDYIEKTLKEHLADKKLCKKIPLKHVPNVAIGFTLVGMSMLGYNTGKSFGKKINKNRKANQNKTISFKPNNAKDARMIINKQAA